MELEEDETEGNGCGCGGVGFVSQCSLASQPEAREPGMVLETEAEPVADEAEAAAAEA